MRLGVAYPNMGEWVDPSLVLRVAVSAEKIGYEVFMVDDHYMLPWTNRVFDAWILLTHVASHTKRIRIGTVVTPIPLRPPGVLAKMVATLDHISGGRVILGVGAGWYRPEFEAFSEWRSARERVDMTREGVELILRLWAEDIVDFKGVYYKVKGAVLEPKPLQKPHPPLWFGTRGRRMLRLTAEYGDGWIPLTMPAEEYGRLKTHIEDLRSSLGRTGGFIYAIYHRVKTDLDWEVEYLAQLKDHGLELAVLLLRDVPRRSVEEFLGDAWDALSGI